MTHDGSFPGKVSLDFHRSIVPTLDHALYDTRDEPRSLLRLLHDVPSIINNHCLDRSHTRGRSSLERCDGLFEVIPVRDERFEIDIACLQQSDGFGPSLVVSVLKFKIDLL